jgi:formylglycine-generating enzyme required for sulfatase activity
MKKVDIYQILFGLLLTVIALFFIFRGGPAHSQGRPQTSMPVAKIGKLTWDVTEITIAEVKTFADTTGFISQAELNGGGLSYESGFVKKPVWTWRSPYGVNAKEQEPAVHLTQKEAQSICRFYGERLPSNAEWVDAAFLEQRVTTPPGFTKGERYLFPGGKDAATSYCLNGCGNYQGLAPSGALNRGTGHVLAGTTKPG